MAAPFLSRRRKAAAVDPQAAAGPSPDAPRRRPLPPAGELRRERRALLRVREERIRDLGGIVLEMYRRDQFREDLVYEQAADIVALDERLGELDALLAAATGMRRAPAVRCACGAPVLSNARFCANCGRAVGARPAIACASCGHALAADAQFCASCGAPAAAAEAGP